MGYPINKEFLSGKFFSMYKVIHISHRWLNKPTTQNTRDTNNFRHATSKKIARKKHSASRVAHGLIFKRANISCYYRNVRMLDLGSVYL